MVGENGKEGVGDREDVEGSVSPAKRLSGVDDVDDELFAVGSFLLSDRGGDGDRSRPLRAGERLVDLRCSR